ncbi:hypothetical protein SUDANB43_02572 [Streptomyces sp. enrichment culture]
MPGCIGGLSHQLPNGGRCTPGFSGTASVAHAVAVGTQARKVAQPGLSDSGYVERSDVVHFDVAAAQLAVNASKIEGADVTPQREPSTSYVFYLPSAKVRVPLAGKRPADEEPPLHCGRSRLVDFVGLRRNEMQLTRADAFRNGISRLAHLSLTLGESLDHEQGRPAAPSGLTGVRAMVRHEICGLATHAVRGSEAWEGASFGCVKRQRTQQLRELPDLRVPRAQLAPAVPHDQSPGKHQFIVSPGRYPHGQYRMSVRRDGGCVQGTAGLAAHLGRSRCQWGMSPSVMVDCTMCLPLHGCKEGA